ncbi:MAG TPA: secondary thiamine-phosphate synthase enzyme YjbQ [Ignavibacteriaceae bacterium]|nr:secondary thiamine-phosphate synthase enzyme YjbQ [Ignavibacteriaceae bacterium]
MIELETHSIEINTKGNCQLTDITEQVQSVITSSRFIEGNVSLFAVGSTTGITTIEYEPGLIKDYPAFFEKIIPSNVSYQHDQTWHDGNGHSHLRSALQKTSFSVPFKNGNLLLGTWQQIIFVDFDNRARSRKIIVQIIGKKA